jgi:hypothetical protein
MQAMGDTASATGSSTVAKLPGHRPQGLSISERRAALMVRCARELAGLGDDTVGDISLPMSVLEFEQALRARYGSCHPELVYRTDSTLERARLERSRMKHLPRVILRQGAPPRASAAARQAQQEIGGP